MGILLPDYSPANAGHSPDAVSMLRQRRRHWANIETALDECPVFVGIYYSLLTKSPPNLSRSPVVKMSKHARCTDSCWSYFVFVRILLVVFLKQNNLIAIDAPSFSL